MRYGYGFYAHRAHLAIAVCLVSSIFSSPSARATTLPDLGLSSVSYAKDGNPIINFANPLEFLDPVALALINAFLHIDPKPGNTFPLLSVSFSETPSQFRLDISGGGLPQSNGGLNEGTIGLSTDYWALTPTLSFRNPNPLFRDLVTFSSTAFHKVSVPGHGPEGLGSSVQISMRFARGVSSTGITNNPAGHNKHYDRYTGAIGGTTSGFLNNTIDTFNISLDGDHATTAPEPASWATMILGFGVIGGALRRARSKLRMSVPLLE